METLPGYDAWKLASPPEEEDFCRVCGKDRECRCDEVDE